MEEKFLSKLVYPYVDELVLEHGEEVDISFLTEDELNHFANLLIAIDPFWLESFESVQKSTLSDLLLEFELDDIIDTVQKFRRQVRSYYHNRMAEILEKRVSDHRFENKFNPAA